ncbi:MAG: LemA family protein [Clostridia bacterium]
MIIAGIALIGLIIYVLYTYNGLVKARNNVQQAYSGIDVYLTQRFELIPNLVECVKGYMIYEKALLENITNLRTKYLQNKNLRDAEILNKECNTILLNVENYPELKASEQFMNLQKNLEKMESQLQAARRIYNMEVNNYNNKVNMFPSNMVAGMGGFEEKEYFEAEVSTKNNVVINNEK